MLEAITETVVLSEIAKFPHDSVPSVNFFGDNYVVRPVLYFKDVDLVLTSEMDGVVQPCLRTG